MFLQTLLHWWILSLLTDEFDCDKRRTLTDLFLSDGRSWRGVLERRSVKARNRHRLLVWKVRQHPLLTDSLQKPPQRGADVVCNPDAWEHFRRVFRQSKDRAGKCENCHQVESRALSLCSVYESDRGWVVWPKLAGNNLWLRRAGHLGYFLIFPITKNAICCINCS